MSNTWDDRTIIMVKVCLQEAKKFL